MVVECPNCQQVKAEHQRSGGLTQLTKSAHFLPIRTTYSAEDYAKLYIQEIVCLHGVPLSIISYRGAQFTTHFWRSFPKGLGTQMAPYEVLYGRKCRSPIGWFELGEADLIGPNLVQQAIEKVKLIRDRLHTTQCRQKSYADVHRWNLEFDVKDWVFLKVSPMKGIMRFKKKWKLRPRYVGPYKIIRKIGMIAYELDLPFELEAVHHIFHVSMLRKCIGDPSHIMPIENIRIEDLSYVEVPIAILDRQVRKLRTKDVASVKVLWRNNNVEEMTWEAEEK
ncbi:uncharacterized protein LOC125863925 [Solanum stenotomum]|uniref:uncharacterized protein LOC125863925 n=1 Tax=Solanum stenotomum TaxID=172797 RepID=UPI0020D15881|nr:uncharacterized protein LOC125863925 [Solanum stenotomum]